MLGCIGNHAWDLEKQKETKPNKTESVSKIFETLDNEIKIASVLLQFGLSSKALGDVEVLKTNDNPIGVTHCWMQIRINSSVGMADDW